MRGLECGPEKQVHGVFARDARVLFNPPKYPICSCRTERAARPCAPKSTF